MRGNLRTKTYTSLALIVLFSSTGNVLLSKGMKQIGELHQWSAATLISILFKVFASGWIWLGIGCQLLCLLSLLMALAWADYSYISPASAIGYAVVALLGYALLGESVSSMRWTGVCTICLGVALVGRTPPNTWDRK